MGLDLQRGSPVHLSSEYGNLCVDVGAFLTLI